MKRTYRLVVRFTDQQVITRTFEDKEEFRKEASAYHRTSTVQEVIKLV